MAACGFSLHGDIVRSDAQIDTGNVAVLEQRRYVLGQIREAPGIGHRLIGRREPFQYPAASQEFPAEHHAGEKQILLHEYRKLTGNPHKQLIGRADDGSQNPHGLFVEKQFQIAVRTMGRCAGRRIGAVGSLRRRQAVRESEPDILQGNLGRVGCFAVGGEYRFAEKFVEPLHPDGILREGDLQPGKCFGLQKRE